MRILVTDAHELAGLGAIRSLGRAGHRVIAGYPGRLQRPASSYSRYCDTWRTYPDPWLSQPDFCQWLTANAPDVDLVLPISEAALVAAVSCRSQLPSQALVAPSTAALEYTLSKRRATGKALALGIPCPRTAFSPEAIPELKSPWIVRTDNRLAADGSYRKGRTWYVEDAGELRDLVRELTEDGEQWMVQEHIVGKGGGAFLLLRRGQAILEFAHERVHEVPFYGGVSSLRRSVRDSATVATATQLFAFDRLRGRRHVRVSALASGPGSLFHRDQRPPVGIIGSGVARRRRFSRETRRVPCRHRSTAGARWLRDRDLLPECLSGGDGLSAFRVDRQRPGSWRATTRESAGVAAVLHVVLHAAHALRLLLAKRSAALGAREHSRLHPYREVPLEHVDRQRAAAALAAGARGQAS